MRTLRVTTLLLALALAPMAHADDTEFGTPIEPELLDALRGGFDVPGLAVGFGLERMVSVNGELVVAQRIDIPNLARMTVEQAQQLAALSDGRSVQVGGGVTITPGVGTVVIQNALDGQQIQALTHLNATTNTLGLLHTLNFTQSLDDALRLGGSP